MSVLKIKDSNGVWQDIPAIKGADGTNGTNGTDGISPIATVTKSGNTATITITDKNGTTTTTISDGTNGTNGTNGQDGRDGYMQYTAGTNITIENGVISATGGGGGGSGTPDNITTRVNSNDEMETIGIYTQQNNARKIWEGTLAQYNALNSKDSDTYYYITDDYSGNGLPSAGTTGQVLAKASNSDFDTEWVSQHSFSHETWTFTLDDDSTVDKEVVLW